MSEVRAALAELAPESLVARARADQDGGAGRVERLDIRRRRVRLQA